jgi:hypothetical protein
MTKDPALAWNKLVMEANNLGRRMKILAKAMKADATIADEYDDLAGIYEEDPAELYLKMCGIADLLKIIGETPNAFINVEGMAAIRCEIERVALIESEAKTLLDKLEPPILW